MSIVLRGTLALSLAVAGTALAGCDMIGGGDKEEAGGKTDAAAGEQGGAKPDAAGDAAEKGNFIKAYVAAACAVKTSEDLSKAIDLTRAAYEQHGFNQMSYASATKKWALDPEVQAAQKEGMAKCAPAPSTEGDAKPSEGDAKPADDDTKPAEGDAKPAEGDAEPAAGDAKPAAKAVAEAGAWSGAVTSKDVTATVTFTVKDDGSLTGEVRGNKPTTFVVPFDGTVKDGKFQLNGRKKGAAHHAFLSGAVDKKGVVVGQWDGTIAKKREKGTWRAAKGK